MLKTNNIVQSLIVNGYDTITVDKLLKVFIDDFLDDEQERLSKYLNDFIEKIKVGDILPDRNNNVTIFGIQKMTKDDFDDKPNSMFYGFKVQVTEAFNNMVGRGPLQKILMSGGAMKYHPEFEGRCENPVRFEKNVVDSPEKYNDLCVVRPYTIGLGRSYIRIGDLYSLLLNKGFNEELVMPAFLEILNSNPDEKCNVIDFNVNYFDIVKKWKTDKQNSKEKKK